MVPVGTGRVWVGKSFMERLNLYIRIIPGWKWTVSLFEHYFESFLF
jgi:hypothetical protein